MLTLMLRRAAKVAEVPHGQDKPAFDLLIVLNVPEKVQRRVSTGASAASQDLRSIPTGKLDGLFGSPDLGVPAGPLAPHCTPHCTRHFPLCSRVCSSRRRRAPGSSKPPLSVS